MEKKTSITDQAIENSIWVGKRQKGLLNLAGEKVEKTEKTPKFWTEKNGKPPEKIGFGQVFSTVLEKIPFFRPKRDHCLLFFASCFFLAIFIALLFLLPFKNNSCNFLTPPPLRL